MERVGGRIRTVGREFLVSDGARALWCTPTGFEGSPVLSASAAGASIEPVVGCMWDSAERNYRTGASTVAEIVQCGGQSRNFNKIKYRLGQVARVQ
jgi:hypothetical protein